MLVPQESIPFLSYDRVPCLPLLMAEEYLDEPGTNEEVTSEQLNILSKGCSETTLRGLVG